MLESVAGGTFRHRTYKFHYAVDSSQEYILKVGGLLHGIAAECLLALRGAIKLAYVNY